MSDQEQDGFIQRAKHRLIGGLSQVFRTSVTAAGGAAIGVYLVDPTAKGILTNLLIALGASVFGYFAGAQHPQEAE